MHTPHPPKTLVDWLDDLTVRFLLNLPSSELSSVPRLCFQVEEAQWFYEDFIRPLHTSAGLPPLPSLHLRQFCLLLFQHCPLLSGFTDAQHIAAYEEFLAYKVRVPVRGAILLDERMEKVVLVKGFKKGASWSFPRGKINKDEKDLDCAIREVYEETGYDVRQAGLVPEDEDEVKYIDITMREQHMRLFVFRGVDEDTHFEPKTRKEISKIQWYSIKDLPGFKKQKAGGDAANANKFYMVAPFLGPLKKWIGLQREKDPVSAGRAAFVGNGGNVYNTQTATEDEGEADEEEDETPQRDLPPSGDDHRSEELRRLLSIGSGPAAAPPARQQQQQPPSMGPTDAQPGDLLAMLRGTNGKPRQPHTPFEQINPFPHQEPVAPHPDHLRHPSFPQPQQQPPQFPFSPPRHQQQRNQSLPTPNIFGPGSHGVPPHQPPPPGFPGMVPPHLQQHHPQIQQQRQSMPGPPPRLPFVGMHNTMNGMPVPQPMPPPPQHLQQSQPFPAPHRPLPPDSYFGHDSQAAIGSGPQVPNASQLPPPRLNANAMNLLNAFRNPYNARTPSISTPPAGQPQQSHRPASTHQSALLDLFRKPSETKSPPADVTGLETDDEPPLSPAATDGTVKPEKFERKPTLNEITRTLAPMKVKSKGKGTRVVPTEVEAGGAEQMTLAEDQRAETRGKHLFDPNNPSKVMPVSKDTHTVQGGQHPRPTGLEQPYPSPRHSGPRSPKPPNKHTSSPSRKDVIAKKKQITTTVTPPPFTILARPGSRSGPGRSAAAPPPSAWRAEAPKVQVLQRPKALDPATSDLEKPADKTDQLLALFGKSPPTTQPEVQPPLAERKESQSQQSGTPLDLSNAPAPLTPTPTPTTVGPPPPAPRLSPSNSAKKQTVGPPTTTKPPRDQHNMLLDLFTNKQKGTASTATSPGTPISPFTLGTPAEEKRRGLSAGVGLGGRDSTAGIAGTEKMPTDAKEFLMGYLNGVVQGEGYRGAKSGGGRG